MEGVRTRARAARIAEAVCLGLGAVACTSGEAADPWWITAGEGSDLPSDEEDGARFLMQAAFGVQQDDLEGLNYAGFEAWFERQLELEPSLQRPTLERMAANGQDVFQSQRIEMWWKNAVQGDDQLRQRMAFALSEIFVVSDRASALGNTPIGLGGYYDMLATGAFGNFRDLLEGVTKSPIMGLYLSHLGNQKGDPLLNIRPDENYAREVMQLFTIGLVELELDGTPRLDGAFEEIPTYTQTDIEELARVLTGWTFAGRENFTWGDRDYVSPMEPWEEYHDDGAKMILGTTPIVAGLTPEADLDAALDALFQHANVAPFIATRLIQRLVTSNPSPAYVARVAAVFEDDGTGERGDLAAVARAILMDTEARTGHVTSPNTFGKLREPMVRLAGMWRTLDARAATGRYRYWNPDRDFGQAPLRSPSVFNFFYPSYAPPGPIADAGLVAPEFQIHTHTNAVRTANEYWERLFRAYPGYSNLDQNSIKLKLDTELALADDPIALVDHLDLYFMAGQMSPTMRSTLITHVNARGIDDGNAPEGTLRVLDAIYLILTSPEGAMQL